jgi:SAM-dependent methyltransferase
MFCKSARICAIGFWRWLFWQTNFARSALLFQVIFSKALLKGTHMEPSEYHNIARLEESHWWYAGMRHISRSLIRGLNLPSSAKILDAGCGVGGGLKWLKQFGETIGIDLHPLAIQYSAKNSHRIARASVQSIPFADNSFDLVTSFEVLYHLSVTDDQQAFNEFERVTRPGGYIVIRVPAHDWLRGAHDRQVHTRHRYEPNELRKKIRMANLRLTRLTYVGMSFWFLAVISRLLENKDETHSDVKMPSLPINTILKLLISAESGWLKWFNSPFGLSLLVVAQKGDEL